MKTTPNPQLRRIMTALAVIGASALPHQASAASGIWTNPASGDWSTGPWTGGVVNGASESATFNQDWSGQIINVDGSFTAGSILATDTVAGGGLTISGGTLILNNGLNAPIISTGTNNAFGESLVNRLKIFSVLDGTNGFERQGSGYLDISGTTNIFTGTIRLTALPAGGGSFTVINSDANLGDAANVITVATDAQPVGFYNDASAGVFTLNSARTITTTGTGDFWVKNKLGANMEIAGIISGTANFRKNDSGTVTLSAANTYAGVTRLDGGILRLSGGNNRLPTGTTVVFNGASTLDLTNTTQSVAAVTVFSGVTNTITGAGGSLTVTNNANFTVNGADATVLDMSGLTNFTYNQPTKDFVVRPATNATTSNNTVNLAKAGTNNITALNMAIGGASGGSQGTAHEGRLGLGTANNFNVTNLNVGGFNGSGLINFQSGLTTPTLTLRGLTGGISRVDAINLGSTSSGVRSGAGVLDLTGGSLDARVTTLTVNTHIASSNNAATSTLTMPDGTLDATTIILGSKLNAGAPTLTSTLNQGGGTVTVQNLIFGQDAAAGATANFQSSYNLAGGTLQAGTIQAGAGAFAAGSVRRIGWTGGTIANYDASTDLSINGVDATTGGRILLAAGTTASKGFDVSAGRTTTLGANTALTAFSTDVVISKTGAGTLVLAGDSSAFGGTLQHDAGSIEVGALNTISTFNSAGFLWNAGELNFDLNGATSSDLLALTGVFAKGSGSSFTFDFGGGGEVGGSYTLATFASSTGFTALDFLASNLDTGLSGNFVLNSGSLVLNVIPEPSTALLIFAGLGFAGLFRNRRRDSQHRAGSH